MSEAHKILDERLAKGEIDDLEYERLKGKIGASAQTIAASQNNTSETGEQDDSDPRTIKRNLAKILFSFGGLGMLGSLWATIETGGLNDTGQTIFTFSCIALGIGTFLFSSSRKR